MLTALSTIPGEAVHTLETLHGGPAVPWPAGEAGDIRASCRGDGSTSSRDPRGGSIALSGPPTATGLWEDNCRCGDDTAAAPLWFRLELPSATTGDRASSGCCVIGASLLVCAETLASRWPSLPPSQAPALALKLDDGWWLVHHLLDCWLQSPAPLPLPLPFCMPPPHPASWSEASATTGVAVDASWTLLSSDTPCREYKMRRRVRVLRFAAARDVATRGEGTRASAAAALVCDADAANGAVPSHNNSWLRVAGDKWPTR